MTPSKNRILGSPEFQISKFSDFGHFEADINKFVKNLWREITHSQIWLFKSEHGSSTAIHGQARARARASTSKHAQILEFSDVERFEPDITDFVKNLWREMTPSKNRISGSPEFQISEFFDFGHFDPDITGFVKNLWREMTRSQIWILGTEHGLGRGHSWASAGWARASTSKHE